MGIFNLGGSSKKFNTNLPIQTGWTPLISWEEYPVASGLYVAKIIDWTGGVNEKPSPVNVYLGDEQLVANASDAIQFGTGAYNDADAIAAIRATVIDDTKGNGDTTFVWSADKTFDELNTTNTNLTNHTSSNIQHGLVADTGWTEQTTLNTNWIGTVYYKKDALGIVHVIIEVQHTGDITGNDNIWTLPVGFRPKAIGNKLIVNVALSLTYDNSKDYITISDGGNITYFTETTYESGDVIASPEFIYSTP